MKDDRRIVNQDLVYYYVLTGKRIRKYTGFARGTVLTLKPIHNVIYHKVFIHPLLYLLLLHKGRLILHRDCTKTLCMVPYMYINYTCTSLYTVHILTFGCDHLKQSGPREQGIFVTHNSIAPIQALNSLCFLIGELSVSVADKTYTMTIFK